LVKKGDGKSVNAILLSPERNARGKTKGRGRRTDRHRRGGEKNVEIKAVLHPGLLSQNYSKTRVEKSGAMLFTKVMETEGGDLEN